MSEDLRVELESLKLQLRAARYAFHAVTAHRYAEAAVRRLMGQAEAVENYRRAMANYDGIVAAAPSRTNEAGNDAEMAKGGDSVIERIRQMGAPDGR